MGDFGQPEIVAEFAEIQEHLDEAAVIGLEERLEHQEGEQLMLREVFAGKLARVFRHGVACQAQSFLRDRAG